MVDFEGPDSRNKYNQIGVYQCGNTQFDLINRIGHSFVETSQDKVRIDFFVQAFSDTADRTLVLLTRHTPNAEWGGRGTLRNTGPYGNPPGKVIWVYLNYQADCTRLE